MSAKILVFCVLAVFIRNALANWIRNGAGSCKEGFGITNNDIGYGAFRTIAPAASASYPKSLAAPGNRADTLKSGYPALDFSIVSANNGGSFNVRSSSPIAPSSISIKSENAIEGTVALEGMLPFLSAVALEGTLPTFGAGGVAYRSGEGVAILSENYEKNDILNAEADENNREIINKQFGSLSRSLAGHNEGNNKDILKYSTGTRLPKLSELGNDISQCKRNNF